MATLLAGLNPFDQDEEDLLLQQQAQVPQPAPQPVMAPPSGVADSYEPNNVMAKPPPDRSVGGLLKSAAKYALSPSGLLAIGTTLRAAGGNEYAFRDQRATEDRWDSARKEDEAKADLEASNLAFGEGWITDDKGKRKWSDEAYLAARKKYGVKADVVGALKGVKDIRDTYAVHGRQAINQNDPNDRIEVEPELVETVDEYGRPVRYRRSGGPTPAGAPASAAAPAAATAAPAGAPAVAAGPHEPVGASEPPAAPPIIPLDAVHAREGKTKNPYSTADGVGQFTEGTWLHMMQQPQFAAVVAGKSPQEILALRHDGKIADQATLAYAAENAPQLTAKGVEATPGNLMMAHGYGPKGAIRIAKAPPNPPQQDTVGAHTAKINRVAGKTTGEIQADFQRRANAAGHVPAPRQIADMGPQGSDAAARAPAAGGGVELPPPKQIPGWEVDFVGPAPGQQKPLTPQDLAALRAGGGVVKGPKGYEQVLDATDLAGAGVKAPAAVQTMYAENTSTMQAIQDARRQVLANKSAFGLKNVIDKAKIAGMPLGEAAMNQVRTPEQKAALAAVGRLASIVRHDLTGAAMTLGEQPYLRPFLPSLDSDNAETILAKLEQMESYVRGENSTLSKQFGFGQNAPGGGPPASKLREGHVTTFANGESWTMKGGQPMQVQ